MTAPLRVEFMLAVDSVTLQYYDMMGFAWMLEDGTMEWQYTKIENGIWKVYQFAKPAKLNTYPVFAIHQKGWAVYVAWDTMFPDMDQIALANNSWLITGSYFACTVMEHPRYARIVSHPATAKRGDTIIATVDWKNDVSAYLALMLREPPDFTGYKSATSTVFKPPGKRRENLTFPIDPNNITGENKIDVQVVT